MVHPVPTVVPSLPEYQTASGSGERTLWVVFVVMLIASGIFTILAWRVPVQKNLYHVITTTITIFASLSYFAMASGHGSTYHHIVVRESQAHVPDVRHDIYRSVYFARYIDWSITTPLLLLDLALLAGLSGYSIVVAIIADVIMVLTGLFAAYGSEGSPQKWGWYAIAVLAYLVVLWHLLLNGRVAVRGKGDKVSGFYTAIASFTFIIWTAYPIIWGIADGSRRLSVNGEIIAYAILDILAKPIFGAWLLITHASLPETHVEVGGFWANGLSREGQLRVGDDDEGA